MLVNIGGDNIKFQSFKEIDTYLSDRNLERTVGHFKEYCIRELHQIGDRYSYYICGTITDDDGKMIIATEKEVIKVYGHSW